MRIASPSRLDRIRRSLIPAEWARAGGMARSSIPSASMAGLALSASTPGNPSRTYSAIRPV